jgi:drug/metabolite transporter (DMT)-like permease
MVVSRPAVAIADNVPLGIVYMVLTTLFFASLDALGKLALDTYPVFMVVWARFTFHLVVVLLVLAFGIRRYVSSGSVGLQLMRSLLMLLTNVLFFAGLAHTQLATATSISFLGPIIVTILSVPLLGETVGLRRWAGVILGFAGALIIIRPGTGIIGPSALFFLASATSHAVYLIITRRIRAIDDPFTTLLYTALVGSVASTLIVPFGWQTPEPADWPILIGLGVCGAIGHFFLIKALQSAPASAVVPFSYSSLAWAIVFGYLLFGDLPDFWTLVGAAIIAGSGIYIFYREQRLRRANAAE